MTRILRYFDGKEVKTIKLVEDGLRFDRRDGSLDIYHNDQLVKTIFTSNYSIDYIDDDEELTDDYIQSDDFGF